MKNSQLTSEWEVRLSKYYASSASIGTQWINSSRTQLNLKQVISRSSSCINFSHSRLLQRKIGLKKSRSYIQRTSNSEVGIKSNKRTRNPFKIKFPRWKNQTTCSTTVSYFWTKSTLAWSSLSTLRWATLCSWRKSMRWFRRHAATLRTLWAWIKSKNFSSNSCQSIIQNWDLKRLESKSHFSSRRPLWSKDKIPSSAQLKSERLTPLKSSRDSCRQSMALFSSIRLWQRHQKFVCMISSSNF